MLRRESLRTNYIYISDIQILLQHSAEDYVDNMQTNWLICLVRVFKVKRLFKMKSRKETPTTFYRTM